MTKLINFLSAYKKAIDDQPLEQDLALFSRLVELPFEKILESSAEPIDLPTACLKLIEFINAESYMTLPADQQILNQITESNRYAQVELSNFHRGPHHFFALTFDLTPKTKILTFRGPNGTLLSWKDDLQFSTLTVVDDIQKQAQATLTDEMNYDQKNIICTGFSKGASIAALAVDGLKISSNRSIQAVLLDSPGLPNHSYKFDIPIVELVSPLSIFALIGEHPFPQITVESSASGIWQHDLYSWIDNADGSFKRTIGITTQEIVLHQFQNLLPQKITDENIQQSINVVFDIFSKLDYQTNSDLIKHWNQFTALIKTTTSTENIVVKMTIQRLQQLIFKNAATNLQSIPLK